MTVLQTRVLLEVETQGYSVVHMVRRVKAIEGLHGTAATGPALRKMGLSTYHTGCYMGVAKTPKGAEMACTFANNRDRLARFEIALQSGDQWFINSMLKGAL